MMLESIGSTKSEKRMSTDMNDIEASRPLNGRANSVKGGFWRHKAMWICCTVMLLPLGAYFLASGTVGGVFDTLGLLAPLVICMGVHALMHRFMGHSCHGAHGTDRPSSERDEAAPLDERKGRPLGRRSVSAE